MVTEEDNPSETIEVDPKHAAAAFKEIEAELKTLAPKDVELPRVRAWDLTVEMLRVARFIKEPAHYKQFAALPGFQIRDVDLFENYVLGLWHCHGRRKVADPGKKSTAKLSGELLESATERKTRLLELLEYYLFAKPKIIAELAIIRSGTGYLDLASDLGELARLHQEHRELIQADTSGRFQPEDAELALVESAAILRELSEAGDLKSASEWADALGRCWTLYRRAYERITRAAGYLFGERPDLDELFPSPFTAGRRAGRKKKAPTLTESVTA